MSKNIIGIVVIVLFVGGGLYYIYGRPASEPVAPANTNNSTTTSSATPLIAWNLIAKENTDPATFDPTMPLTDIVVIIGNKQYAVVTSYKGGCYELDARGLSKGELSAVTCWWGGAGDEFGVFFENGALVLKKVSLDEESGGADSHVGNFKVLQNVLSDKNARPLDPTSVVKTYQKLARAKPVADLRKSILEGSKLLVQKYDTDLGYRVSADLREYVGVRNIVDVAVESANGSLIDLYGPCWGIPEGDCRE